MYRLNRRNSLSRFVKFNSRDQQINYIDSFQVQTITISQFIFYLLDNNRVPGRFDVKVDDTLTCSQTPPSSKFQHDRFGAGYYLFSLDSNKITAVGCSLIQSKWSSKQYLFDASFRSTEEFEGNLIYFIFFLFLNLVHRLIPSRPFMLA